MGETERPPGPTPSASPAAAYDEWHAHLEGVVEADDPWHQLARLHLGSIDGADVGDRLWARRLRPLALASRTSGFGGR